MVRLVIWNYLIHYDVTVMVEQGISPCDLLSLAKVNGCCVLPLNRESVLVMIIDQLMVEHHLITDNIILKTGKILSYSFYSK